ncbi:hypothetical protein [Endozoicomonas sp. ISHI1]|uniref:hypothetical protein n=1 Tax=Endozoicomonas sp. ISHI1 TaxID=2825882 RepID=UPI002147D422|nr:hypothetical protein [Endozoicomonas sp. ISHI1]
MKTFVKRTRSFKKNKLFANSVHGALANAVLYIPVQIVKVNQWASVYGTPAKKQNCLFDGPITASASDHNVWGVAACL